MALAYVDMSCLVAIAFEEPASAKLAERLEAEPEELLFATLDRRQGEVAGQLGFQILGE